MEFLRHQLQRWFYTHYPHCKATTSVAVDIREGLNLHGATMRRIKGHLGPIRDLVISASLDALNKWVSFAGIFLFSFFFSSYLIFCQG